MILSVYNQLVSPCVTSLGGLLSRKTCLGTHHSKLETLEES
jgi:hypothetical protein